MLKILYFYLTEFFIFYFTNYLYKSHQVYKFIFTVALKTMKTYG